MEIVGFEPDTVKSHFLPMQETRIIPIGDIQYGIGTDIDRLKSYLKWGMKQKAYFVGLGDYIDCASPSNRKLLSSIRHSLYDSVRRMMDERVSQYVEELQKILKPTRGRWLGLLTGHHFWPLEDGTSTDSRLASYLGCPLLGHCAEIILRFRKERNPRRLDNRGKKVEFRNADAKIWLHHGAGGGITEGAAFTRLGHVSKVFFANVYIMGHVHKKGVIPIPWIDFDMTEDGQLRSVGTTRYLVLSGGFLKAYEQGSTDSRGYPSGGYVEQRMLNPVALGSVLIMIRPTVTGGYPRIDVNVSV